jgi:hypothetical protein
MIKELDEKGRCCGRKPLLYKRSTDPYYKRPHYFCCRCDASFDAETKEQIANWAYEKTPSGGFECRRRTL